MLKAAQSVKLYYLSYTMVLLKFMVGNYGILSLIKLILGEVFCLFVFSLNTVAWLVNG